MERTYKGNNLIDFPDEYVCIDIETTGLDFEYDEIIEVAAIRIKSGEITNRMSTLAKPVWPVSQFITDLTGITNEMLETAPAPDIVFPSFCDFIGDSVLVGHNVNFDINFLYDACKSHGLTLKNDFIDTMRLARKLLPNLPHHRLADIVEALDVQHDDRHRAEGDAIATFYCLEKMKQEVASTIGIDSFKDSFKKKYHGKYNVLADIVLPEVEIDDTNPIFGKQVVFTGALSRMNRKSALQIVANLGGIPTDSVTKKTNYLVVGNEEFVKSVKDGKTNKMKKADEYRLKGLDIVTLSEDTFFDMIE